MTYKLDPEKTRLEFSVRHMMIATVKGSFSDVSAEISIDPGRLESAEVKAKIGVASVKTKDRLRDDYLTSKDFFNPAAYPYMEYRSTSVRPRGKSISVSGVLKIRDQERQLILSGTWQEVGGGKDRIRFLLSGEIDRESYGLVFNGAVETVSVVVGKKVTLDLSIEVTKSA
jgi:polyisoprenoid-binding protein YceI